VLIDWFTVAAQALNFVILVWLMKRFAYQPVLDAIDAREKRIAAALADADAVEARAHKERDEFQRKNEDLERQRAALIDRATKDANAERERLLGEARQAADALAARRQEALLADAKRLDAALVRRAQREVFEIARKTLADLASASLEARVVDAFARRLRGLDGPAGQGIAQALATATGPALVRSAFDVPAEQRAGIQTAINETFSADVALRFETAPDLVAGIELSVNGQKVAWSISGYLASLQQGVDELLEPPSQARSAAAPAP
jgi:F-type H+-transporting ATPase subunit b